MHGVYGKGNIELSSIFGKIKTITDVLYVLDLKKNLLSIGMITNRRNIVMFDFDKCQIIQNQNPNVVIAKGVKDSKKWTLQARNSICKDICPNSKNICNTCTLGNK
jgi:hypothetical protein